MSKIFITFASVHYALRARRVLERAGVTAELLPVPRDIDLSCGQCLHMPAAALEKALALLQRQSVPWSGVYRPLGRRLYEQIYGGEDGHGGMV